MILQRPFTNFGISCRAQFNGVYSDMEYYSALFTSSGSDLQINLKRQPTVVLLILFQ